MQHFLAPIFSSHPCSRGSPVLLTPQPHQLTAGRFGAGLRCSLGATEQARRLSALAHTSAALARVFCPQSQDPPHALPSFAAEGLLPEKRSLRESSGMLVMWPRLQQHPILLAGIHFSGDSALLAHAGEWAEQTCSQVPPKT